MFGIVLASSASLAPNHWELKERKMSKGRFVPVRWLLAVAAVALLAVSVAACGSSSGGASTSETTGGEAKELTKLYAGEWTMPPTSGPKAEKGKEVWFISCGQAFENCAKASEAFEDAGTALGWNVNVVDGEANPSKANELIKQAVAAHVDGIASIAWDCPTIKSGLLAAKQAGIPTVNFGGFDCDFKAFGGGEPLFTKTENVLGGTSFENYIDAYETARADAMLTLTGGGDEKILQLEEQSLTNSKVKSEAFKKEVEAKCPECGLIPVKWQYAQVPQEATQIWKSAIQQNPDAEVLVTSSDDIMNLGLRSAIQQSGHRGLFVMGAEAPPPNQELIREGFESAALAIPPGFAWQMWGEADTLNRVFAKSDEFPDEGGGWVLLDKEHVPAEGEEIKTPDYQGEFEKIWNG
jgi:ribose transport system substrate-binding protein